MNNKKAKKHVNMSDETKGLLNKVTENLGYIYVSLHENS